MTLHALRTFRTAALSFAVASSLTLASAVAHAQTNSYPQRQTNSNQSQTQRNDPSDNRQNEQQRMKGVTPSTTDMSVPDTDVTHGWTQDQILTATVHQAWELSGRNEANFFEIVKELAEISARNRGLSLPDDTAAGRRAGEYIKEQAKADHNQLLYDIVDKSIQMTGKPAPASAYNNTGNGDHHDNDSRSH